MEKSINSPKMTKQIIPMEGIVRFPERLNLVMEGMTNVELAAKTGLTEATIRNYRKGKSYPTLDKLKELAEACKCPLDWLATGNLNKNEIRENEIDFESEVKELAVWLSNEEKVALISFIRREGINSLLRIAGSAQATNSGSIDDLIENLPVRDTLKQAIKEAAKGDEHLDKEILRRIENRKNSLEAGQQSLDQPELEHKKIG